MRSRCSHSVIAALTGACLLTACVTDMDTMDDVGSALAPLIGAGAEDAIPDQYIVVFDEEKMDMHASMSGLQQRQDASRVEHVYSIIPGFAARLTPQALADLRRDPSVRYIEQDRMVSPSAIFPTDSAGLDRIDQRELPLDGLYNDWGYNGTGAHAYIVDSGIRETHVEFTGRIGEGYGPAGDCNGNGTWVASIVAGTNYGVAKNAILHSVRVLDCNGSGSLAGVIAGVDFVRTHCTSNGWPCVAAMSIGGGASSALDDAVANTISAGVAFAVVAGSSNANACNYSPARVASAITVAATDANDNRASYSNFGTCVNMFAPGTATGASNASDVATITRAGASAALVAGAVALRLQAYPGATPAQSAQALLNSGTYGCINNAGSGSPNVLVYNDFHAGPYQCGSGGPDPNSCQGHCGGAAPGGCYCDVWCTYYNDCCADYLSHC